MKIKLFKTYKAAAYLPNLYTLLQYLLLEPYWNENTQFFIQEKFPRSVACRLPGAVFLRVNSKYNFLISLFKIYKLILRNRKIRLFLGAHLTFTDTFLRYSKNVVYLEDGTASYENSLLTDKGRQVRMRRKGFWLGLLAGDLYPWYGLAEHVQTIYLTGILPIPPMIADKVELINLKELWLQKSKEQQEAIIRVFLPADFDRNLIREYAVFLLTQPFSEISCGRFSEMDKIDVYRKLVSPYDESELVIKTHPAETTDYSHYFPKARIIKVPCPMELLVFMGLRAQIIISVNSTSIFGLSDFPKKIIAGFDVTPALKKETLARGIYEDIDNQMQHMRCRK